MSHCTVKEALGYVRDVRGAIAAFNVHNLEFVQGVVWAAEEMKAPVILMLSEPTLQYARFEQILSICLLEAKNASVPVAIALDHGKDDIVIRACIDAGIDIMFDGSHLQLEENVARTIMYRDLTLLKGLSLEGEVGQIGSEFLGEGEVEHTYTNPLDAVMYSEKTNVDALAISIGNLHGKYEAPPKFNIEILKKIASETNIPIVLHGGSNVPDEQIRLAVENGAKKCNFGTDLRYAFFEALALEIANDNTQYKPFGILSSARSAVYEVAKQKIKICNSHGIV